MTLEIFSILFFIPCTWSIRLYVDERGVSDLSSLAGGRKYLTYAHSRWVSTDYSLYCPSEPECVCNQERDGYVLHCEKEVHASMTPVEAKNGKLDLQCDVTLPSDGLRHDYYLTLGLEEFEEVRIEMIACPEPPESYSSLFSPSASLSQNGHLPRLSYIKVLVIDCGVREPFSLTTKHFEGLNELEHLEISCADLHKLPDDLFRGKLPNLLYLNISNSAIESIPDGFLSSLSNLQHFILESNRIQELTSTHLKDAASLRTLHISERLLTSLGNDVFNPVPNLERFSLKNTSVTVLPTSLGILAKLNSITLVANKIESIEKDHCASWENVEQIRIEDNPLKRVDFECFFRFENLTLFIMIETSFSNLPDKPLMLNNLRRLVINKNIVPISRASRFIESKTLEELDMDGSNIKSFDHDFLHSCPNLRGIILSNNGFSSLHGDFFSRNRYLQKINLENNMLATIPLNLFLNNPYLEVLILTDNAISHVSSSMFSRSKYLNYLSLAGNNLTELPSKFLSNLAIQIFNISNNNISKLEPDSFAGLRSLVNLDLSNNILADSNMTCFLELANSNRLFHLNLSGNAFPLIPPFNIRSLRNLNISNNKLNNLEVKNFRDYSELKTLDLSKNNLKTMSKSVFIGFRNLNSLDLSFNELAEIPERALYYAVVLRKLQLSGNKIRKFDICIMANSKKLEELDLSGNGLHSITHVGPGCFSEILSLKKLDLSNNDITFNNTNWIFDYDRKSWGSVSPLLYFPNIEEIRLANNSISTIFMDWRNMLVNLRILDLRYNKIKYLTHQDMLFSTTILHTDGRREPMKCFHSLQVDLRHNLIAGMELPNNMLVKRRKGKCFANVTMMLEDNPFNCGCDVIKVLRLFDGDVVLTSELQRSEGVNWILPAKIEPGNLSCWTPETVRGKRITDTETWMHHIIPTLGVCSLIDDF